MFGKVWVIESHKLSSSLTDFEEPDEFPLLFKKNTDYSEDTTWDTAQTDLDLALDSSISRCVSMGKEMSFSLLQNKG